MNRTDAFVAMIDDGLRTLAATPAASRPSPADAVDEEALDAADRDASIALLRVNHAGEISAQALYNGQSVFARSEATRQQLRQAAAEERDTWPGVPHASMNLAVGAASSILSGMRAAP